MKSTISGPPSGSDALVWILLFGLVGAGMSTQRQSAAVFAGIGAVGGAFLTDGSPLGTIGAAVVGGMVGHEIAKRQAVQPERSST